MRILLGASRAIDWINEQFSVVANWLILLADRISACNAFRRYLFSERSNGWLEIPWYMFAGVVLLGGPYTLKLNEHVRVDLVYGMVSERTRIWIDIIGGFLFLLPICDPRLLHLALVRRFLAHQRDVDQCRRPAALAGQADDAGRLRFNGAAGHLGNHQTHRGAEHVIDIEFKYEKPLQ